MGTVGLHDIKDVAGFVGAAVRKTGLELTADEREILLAEGLVEIYTLNKRYNGTGTFSGYATRYLPGLIVSAWHRHHRGEHVRSRDSTGKCVWTYRTPIVSLDAELESPTFNEAAVRPILRFDRAPAATHTPVAA